MITMQSYYHKYAIARIEYSTNQTGTAVRVYIFPVSDTGIYILDI